MLLSQKFQSLYVFPAASTYDKRMPSWLSSSSYFDVVPKPRIGRRSGDFLAVAGASKPPIDYYSSAAEDINQTLKRFGMSMIPMARIGKRNDADYNDEENIPSEFLSPLVRPKFIIYLDTLVVHSNLDIVNKSVRPFLFTISNNSLY